jgi:TolB-like protein
MSHSFSARSGAHTAAGKAVAAAMLAVGLLGAGCSTQSSVYTKPEPTYEEAKASPFVAANREAVAALMAGVDVASLNGTPMLVATVVNVNDLRKTAPLGRTLSEQYASLLVERGLIVKELKLRGDIFVRETTGELMLSREIKDIAKMHSAGVVLVGTYSVAANATYVSIKLVRTDSGQILRGHDYALPNNSDVKRLLDIK